MRHLFSLRSICVALLPLLFVFVACDSGGSNGGETEVNNEFTLNVSPKTNGSESATAKASRDTTIDGFSFFYTGQNQAGEEAFVIYLSGNDSFSPQNVQDGLFGFLARNSAQPSPGQYNMVDLDQGFDSGNFIGLLYEDFGTDGFQDAPYYVPQGGTVDLSTSAEDEVSGTIDIPTAYKITINVESGTVDSTEVSLSGSFTAKSAEEFAPLQTP